MAITGFKDLVVQDIQSVFLNTDEHAITCTYTPVDQSPVVDVQIILDIGEHRDKIESHQRKVATADVSIDDIGTDPGVNDVVEINGEEWFVVDVVSVDDGVAVLWLESDVRPDPGA